MWGNPSAHRSASVRRPDLPYPRDTPDVPSAVTWLLGTVILLGPPLSVVGLVLGARGLSKRGAPRVAVRVAYVLAAVAGLVTVAGYLGATVVAVHPSAASPSNPPRRRARWPRGSRRP